MPPDSKIFCISYQRTGTTSVAEFFRQCGYRVVDWSFDRKKWTEYYLDRDYERIFSSDKFREFQVFEDHPWFLLDFYKYLYHRFPDAKFVHFVRDSDKWFDSLKYLYDEVHNSTIFYWHFKAYGLLDEYYKMLENSNPGNLPRLRIDESQRAHYIGIYEMANREITRFFDAHDKGRIIQQELEDPEKWKKLVKFFDIECDPCPNVHENKSR